MKNLKKLKGATLISKKDQKSIKGGAIQVCRFDGDVCFGPGGIAGFCEDRVCIFW